jgi:hypothetical protein
MAATVDALPDRAQRRAAASHLWTDLVIAAVLLMGSGVWATRYFNAWTARGEQVRFYQEYFEPAVMIACGRGFVVASSQPPPPPLNDFLLLRRDAFDCRDIPPGIQLGREGLYQRPWFYLMLAVGWTWRLLGISWSGLGPLFGLLYGSVIALAYGILRFGMGRVLAVAASLGLMISAANLLILPNLRDYAKAPFTLALILILGLLVTRPVRRRTVLALAATYGAVLGVGYGFRTDFLVNLPVIVIVLFAFLEGGIAKHVKLKCAAAALAIATFIVVSWPVTSAVYTNGGCQWHVALLGLQTPFDRELHVTPAPYDFGYRYSDSYIYRIVSSYARRMPTAIEQLPYCSHEYDAVSGAYLQRLVAGFPADFATRAYSAAMMVTDLPFRWWDAPMTDWAARLYTPRAAVLHPMMGRGVLIVVPALVLASMASLRVAFFLLFFVLYFGGYPAIQFADRHYFHLEFITWWAAGFIVHQTLTGLWAFRTDAASRLRELVAGIRRAAVFVVVASVAIVGALQMARWYQHRRVKALVQAYIDAPKRPVAVTGTAGLQEIPRPVPGDEEPPTWQFATQFLEVDLNEAACGPRPSVTFRYDASDPEFDFSRTVILNRRSALPGPTRVFFVAYEHFKGLELSDTSPGCFVSASRVVDLRALPLLLDITIAPDWERQPLHQRLARWEGR